MEMCLSTLSLPYKVKRKHNVKISKSWLVLSLILLAATSIPYFTYITDQNADLLLIMVQVIIGAQIIVTVRTLLTVNATFARLRQMTGNMDLLKLTGVDANTLIFGNRNMLVRQTALPHFLLVLPKLGLVLGIAQYLHVAPVGVCSFPTLFDTFCYFSHNSWQGYGDVYFIQPILMQFVFALAILMLFTFAEIRLTVALGIWLNTTPLKRSQWLMIFGMVFRGLIIGVSILGITQLQGIRDQFQMRWRSGIYCYDEYGSYNPTHGNEQECQETVYRNNVTRVLDTLQVGTFTLTDTAIMLSANVMRPNLGRFYILEEFNFDYKRGSRKTSEYNHGITYRDSQWQISAWRFISRMFASAVLGLILYGIITYLLLYSAQRMAMRRGFL
jgi:hypothetical protein